MSCNHKNQIYSGKCLLCKVEALTTMNADLLAALELGVQETVCYNTINNMPAANNNQWLVMARAAIAKAKGEG